MDLAFNLQSSSSSIKAEKDDDTNEYVEKKDECYKTSPPTISSKNLHFKSRKTLKRQEHVTCK